MQGRSAGKRSQKLFCSELLPSQSPRPIPVAALTPVVEMDYKATDRAEALAAGADPGDPTVAFFSLSFFAVSMQQSEPASHRVRERGLFRGVSVCRTGLGSFENESPSAWAWRLLRYPWRGGVMGSV